MVLLFFALPPQGSAPPQFFEFLGRFHTLAVHLPIGVLLLVATAELLTRLPKLRTRIDPALDLALPFLVLTSVAAFSLGVLLARGGGYPPKLVALHRGFTLAAVVGSAASLLAWVTRLRADGAEHRLPYRATLAVTVTLLTIGAHFGGSMTHGDSYLTRYAPAFVQKMMGAEPPAPVEQVASGPVTEPLVFAATILPLLKRECVECHGPDKTKGGLRLDSLAAIVKGGEHGAAIVPGHGENSLLVKRMRLPGTEDEHMPPTEKPQPTAGEIDLMSWWIDRGANETLRVKDAIVPDAARTILGKSIDPSSLPSTPGPVPDSTKASPHDAVSPAAVAVPSTPTTPPSTNGGRLAYRNVIAPLLATSCGKCHGDAKQKGKLRVDSIAALTTGGKSGAAITAGDVSHGTLLTRVHLPLSDDKHMPPSEEHQLTPAQVAMISSWIAHGANETMLASELPGGGASARTSVATANAKSAAPTSLPDAKPAELPNTPLVVGPGQIALYRDVVAPVLARRCGECHSGKRSEGGMRIDDLEALVRDQDMVPGKPETSPIVKRMALAANDSERMPPPEKPPAEAWETAAVSMWVAKGARADAVVATSDLPADVAQGMNAMATPGVTPAVTSQSTTSGKSNAGTSLPAGAVIAPRSSGCGACAVGSDTHGDSNLALAATALVALAFAIRRNARVVGSKA